MACWKLQFILILSCVCTFRCQTPGAKPQSPSDQTETTETNEVKKIHVRQAWIQMDKDLKSGVGKIIRRAMPYLMKEIYKKDVTPSCLGALMQLSTALRQSKLWAYKMLDSSGRFPEGFLSGTLTSLGNYEECVKIQVNETKLKLQGQYCTISLNPPIPSWKPFTTVHFPAPELLNVSAPDTVITYLTNFIHNLHVTSIKVGVCSPSLCTAGDLDKLVKIIPEKLGLTWDFDVVRCETYQSVIFTDAQVTALYAMGVVVFLALVGTVVDMIWSSEEMESRGTKSMVFNTVKSFSVLSNARKLSDFTCPQDNLGFVYGMVFIVFCWVVISNTFMYVNYDVTSNFVEALRILQNLFYEIVLNRVLPLQVLFFISGFLMTYRWIKGSEKNFHVCKFLFKKYIRYTIAYGLIIALVIISPTWGSGPSWSNYLTPMYKKCSNNWWYNLLYINNFLEAENSCLEHTWVFAITAQLYIVGVFVILVLKLNPKVGLMFMFFLTVASLATVALTNVYYDLPPNEMSAFLDNRDRFFYAEHSHYRLYTHISIYCAGIFVGYFTAKNPDIKISRKMSWILWVTTTSGFIAALCTVHEWRSGYMPSPMVAAVYTTFSKVAEMAFLSWLTTACMTGHAGGLNSFLSWRPFCFLARLTFIAYAMHVPLITMLNGFRKSHMFISQLEIFYVVLSYAAATYVISYILHMFFEAPWISLSDVIRRRSNVKTFTCYENPTMTEKPIKNGEKPINITISNKNWLNSLEKGGGC